MGSSLVVVRVLRVLLALLIAAVAVVLSVGIIFGSVMVYGVEGDSGAVPTGVATSVAVVLVAGVLTLLIALTDPAVRDLIRERRKSTPPDGRIRADELQ